MTFGFIVFYKVKRMTPEEVQKAREEWSKFRRLTVREELAESPGGGGVRIVGEYSHCWGMPYSGFLVVESEDLKSFHEWWHKFRDLTRWYVDEVHTVISQKAEY